MATWGRSAEGDRRIAEITMASPAVVHIDCAPGETTVNHEEDRGRCPVCQVPWQEKIDQDVPIEATTTPCGHVFCTECLFWAKETLSYGGEVECPVCRQTMLSDSVPAPGETIEEDVIYVGTTQREPAADEEVVEVVEDLE